MGIGVEGEKLGLDVPIVYVNDDEGSIDAVKLDLETEKVYYRLRISKLWVEKNFFYFSTIRLLFNYQFPLGVQTLFGRIVQIEKTATGVDYTISNILSEAQLKAATRVGK